ncbi:EF-hand domain-containing protein [Pontibacter oryzae]|uniref:EF-hand domain-containing protein n=2 Tax=Pontibacter oryzae TaxID=2304593 RepID=A0A399SL93_9BACT|nr:EF-hand domain-containing protein [Pontibacter oryzae]
MTAVACATQQNQTSTTNQRPAGERGGPPTYAQLLAEMDANKDGKLAKSEIKGPLANDFSKLDANNDGYITESELKNASGPRGNRPRQ